MVGVLVVYGQDFILSVVVEFRFRGSWFESEGRLDVSTIFCVFGHTESLEVLQH
jgi:hypothetical protein